MIASKASAPALAVYVSEIEWVVEAEELKVEALLVEEWVSHVDLVGTLTRHSFAKSISGANATVNPARTDTMVRALHTLPAIAKVVRIVVFSI